MKETLTFQEADYSIKEYSREVLEISIMWMLMGKTESIKNWIKRKTWNKRKLQLKAKNLLLAKEYELYKNRVMHFNLKNSEKDTFRGLGPELAKAVKHLLCTGHCKLFRRIKRKKDIFGPDFYIKDDGVVMFYKNGEIYLIQWLVSSYNNNKSHLLLLYYRVEFRKYSLHKVKDKKKEKKEQYLDICLVQTREDFLLTFNNMEILSVQLYNYGNILRVTRENLSLINKATSIFKFIFQNDINNSFKSEYFYLDYNVEDPDGTKVSHQKLIEQKRTAIYCDDFFTTLEVYEQALS